MTPTPKRPAVVRSRRGPPPFFYLVIDANGVRRGIHVSLILARKWAQMVGDGPATICRYRKDSEPFDRLARPAQRKGKRK